MLSDSIDTNDNEKQQNDPGLPFIQQWDLASKHAPAPPPANTLAASQSVLESLRLRRGGETAQWLNRLSGEVLKPSPTASQQGLNSVVNPDDRLQQELIRWLDKLFGQFEAYATQFNPRAQGTDLIVTCSSPIMNEQTYQGHVVTRYWVMLLRGAAGTVNVFVIPAELLLGFDLHSVDESAYHPLLTIDSEWKDNTLNWHIAGTNIVIDHTPLLARELFGDLIRVASGQMSETDLFAHPLQEMNLGQDLAVGYNAT